MRNRQRLSAMAAILLLSASAQAEVVESQAGGLNLQYAVTVAAAPEKVYAAFVDIGKWWDPAHTYSGDAANLSLVDKPGGCFCEKLPQGGGVVHLTVLYAALGRQLTLGGALGPLQTAGVSGAMAVQMSAKDAGTQLALVYRVGGYYPGGLNTIAAGVDGVLGSQLARLKRFVETGSPAESGAAKR
ncbi:MAG: hypothetical protein JWQ90_1341 [Hydrocarboniphaga sp.]|uniref:hypothetical protein n=1 Tax=Hydrocarboniphaga sp. TaxID=2033016 RepID=UPI0026172A62|nr:hypothetical protein [Hydrocarboniphaga sp.]MDB5968891.1 hypothetical protein [Hydrocarboniphaga sp.]